ncbi:GNAT family N-acetyltransferase [Acidisoma sp.]|uniref:GNAT family N-acetyltransferase n=1 Tax=Acidisoma sp. TaxID=1872115 RepID=UPI0038D0B099
MGAVIAVADGQMGDGPEAEAPQAKPLLSVDRITAFSDEDLLALCEATDAAIIDGGGFGWLTPPGRQVIESYFKGLLMVPERELYLGRVDGVIVGSAQLVRPPRNNEAQAMAATVTQAFVAPYARRLGLARMMVMRVEERARNLGYQILNLDVRETHSGAIALYEGLGYIRWGTHPAYARIGGQLVAGAFFYKLLQRKS